MAIPIVTHPVTKIPWQPSKRQVIAAAMAVARVDVDGWNRLQQSIKDDLMIDGHAAIIAAYRQSPQDAFADHSGKGNVGDVVCMTKEHADLYAALFRLTEKLIQVDDSGLDFNGRMEEGGRIYSERAKVIDRLRALASPEGKTP